MSMRARGLKQKIKTREVNKMNGIGQNFDDFMIEQGLYDEAQELAEKMRTSHVASEFRASTIQENSSELGDKGGRLRAGCNQTLRLNN
jgi:hypothetical protein